jgi:hypothetical protein
MVKRPLVRVVSIGVIDGFENAQVDASMGKLAHCVAVVPEGVKAVWFVLTELTAALHASNGLPAAEEPP